MEFELVIVYNFFSESKYIKLWDKVLNQITLEKKSSDLEELKEKLQKENFTMIRKNIIQTCPEILGYKNFEDSTKQEQYIKNLFESSSFQNKYEEDKEKIISLIINEKKNYIYPKKKEDFTFDIHKYFEFCTELKKFYVLISRPKTFLLFYEDKNNKNLTPETQCIINGIYFYFIKHGLVLEYNENIVSTIIDYFNKITFSLINEEELREIAWKEFNKKNYKRASFFFLKTKLRKEGLLSLSFDLYEKLRMISDETTNGKKDRENIAQNIIQYLNEIGEYGDINDKIGIKGYCFEIIGEYSNAIKEYEKRKMYDRCGNIAYKKLENIDFAMYYYKLHGNIEMTLFLLNKKKAYKKIFEYLSLIIDQLDLFDYNKMVKQYINIYWQNIIPEIKYINLKFDVNPNQTQKKSNLFIETFDIFHLKLKRFFNEQTKTSIQLESYLNFFIDINELDNYFNSETSKKQIISFFHKYHSNIVKLKRKKPNSYNSDETKEINFYDNVDTTIRLILKYLSELEASELLNNFIDTYLLGNNDSIIQTIIEQTPYLMCHKKSSFKIESYASYLFSSEQSFQIFRENSKQVNKIINEIIFNTEKDDLFLQNVILKLKTIHHFFLDIFDEKDLYKINNCIGSILSLPHIIEFKMENIGQHYVRHLSSVLYNISSCIRIHLCNLLIEPSLYCNQFEKHFPILHKFVTDFLNGNVSKTNIIDEMNYFAKEIQVIIRIDLEKKIQLLKIFTLDKLIRIIISGSIISIYLFIVHLKEVNLELNKEYYYNYILIEEFVNFFNFISNIPQTISTTTKIILFSLFNAFGISYFSNWEKLKELSLYKKKEFCLTYALSPMFYFPNTFEPLLTKKNIFTSLFDAHGINLISEYSLPYTLFKNSIINIFDFTCSNVKPKQFGNCIQLMDYIKNARVDANYQNFFYYYVPSFFLRYDCNNIDLFTSDFEEFYFQPSKEGLFPLLYFFKLFFLYLPFKDSFICTFIKHFVYNLSNSEENKKTNSTKNYIIILLNKLFDLNYSYSLSNFSQNKNAPIDYKEFEEQHYFQVLLSLENDLQYIPWVISLLWLKKLNIFVLYGFYDVIQQRPVIYDFNNILKCDEDPLECNYKDFWKFSYKFFWILKKFFLCKCKRIDEDTKLELEDHFKSLYKKIKIISKYRKQIINFPKLRFNREKYRKIKKLNIQNKRERKYSSKNYFYLQNENVNDNTFIEFNIYLMYLSWVEFWDKLSECKKVKDYYSACNSCEYFINSYEDNSLYYLSTVFNGLTYYKKIIKDKKLSQMSEEDLVVNTSLRLFHKTKYEKYWNNFYVNGIKNEIIIQRNENDLFPRDYPEPQQKIVLTKNEDDCLWAQKLDCTDDFVFTQNSQLNDYCNRIFNIIN